MKVETIGDVTIVITDDRLDAGMAPKLKTLVRELVQEPGTRLVIDLGNTRLIDSSGCGELVASFKVVSRNQGDMKIARPTAQVNTLLQLTGLHRVLDIHDSLESALDSFVRT